MQNLETKILLSFDTELSELAFNKIATKHNIHYSDVYHYACCVAESIQECPNSYLHFTEDQLFSCYLGLIEDTIKENK